MEFESNKMLVSMRNFGVNGTYETHICLELAHTHLYYSYGYQNRTSFVINALCKVIRSFQLSILVVTIAKRSAYVGYLLRLIHAMPTLLLGKAFRSIGNVPKIVEKTINRVYLLL